MDAQHFTPTPEQGASEQITDQATEQVSAQPAAQSTEQPAGQTAWQPAGQTAWQPAGQPAWQPTGPTAWQPAGQTAWQPAGQTAESSKAGKKYPVLTIRRTGRFYSWTCIAAQLGATAIYFLIALFAQLMEPETANVVLFYANFSTQLVLAGAVIIFLARFRLTLPEVGVRKAKPMPCIIGVVFACGAVFVGSFVEMFFSAFLGLIGYQTSSVITDIPMDGGLVFLALFLIAVMPAIFEELIFRGIILESTKKLGTLQACLINGFLFSLFHCNPSQTGYTFVLGAVFAFVAIRTGSVIPSMIVHFLNNGYSVILMYFGIYEIPALAGFIILGVSFVIFGLGLFYFLKKNTTGNELPALNQRPFWKGATGGIIFNGVLWLLVLIGGILSPFLLT